MITPETEIQKSKPRFKTIDDRFYIDMEEKLGQGAYGEIYRFFYISFFKSYLLF